MKGLKIKLLMKIDWDQIDEFQDQAGNTAAYGRACDFMLAYTSQIQKPLPGIATEGLKAARNFRDGTVGLDERKNRLETSWAYLREGGATTRLYNTGTLYCPSNNFSSP